MKISLYIYNSKGLIDNPELNETLLEHVNRYNHPEKRRVSGSNYFYATKVLNHYGGNMDTVRFIEGKAIVDDFSMSFSHSKKFFGFTIGKLLNGFDVEEIIEENRTDRLAKRILDKKLYKKYEESNDKPFYVTKMWTEFESSAKMTGIGIDFMFNHQDIVYKTFRIEDSLFTVCAKEEFELDVYLNGEFLGDLIYA